MAGDFGFPANLRLHSAKEFDAVFRYRRVSRGQLFDLHYRPGNGAAPRLGLVIAKKLARHATWRNAIKRVGREAFRQARGGLPALDLVLRLARPVAAMDGAAKALWRADIDKLLAGLPR